MLSTFFQAAFALITPIYVLFLNAQGLSPSQITTVSTTFMLSVFFLEIPTGSLADAYGRKVSTIVGWFLRAASFFVYYWADTFTVFLIAEFVGAIGAACVSGAFEAWVREGVDYKGYLNVISKTEIIIRAVSITLNIAAGYLAYKFGYKNLFLIGGLLLIFTAFTGLIFMKPNKSLKKDKHSLRGAERLLEVINHSTKTIFNSKFIKLFLLSEFIIGISFEAVKMFWVFKFANILGNEKHIGTITAISSVILIIGSFLAGRIGRDKKNVINNLIIVTLLTALSVFITTLTNFFAIALMFYLTHDLFKKIMKILRRVYIQEHISSKIRSSLTSFTSMVKTLGSVLGLTLAGFLVENYSVNTAWTVSSILIASIIFVYIRLRLL